MNWELLINRFRRLHSKRLETKPPPTAMARDTKEDERSLNRRLDSLRRERDSVRRLLEQAALNGVAESIDRLGKRLDRLDSELSGENGA